MGGIKHIRFGRHGFLKHLLLLFFYHVNFTCEIYQMFIYAIFFDLLCTLLLFTVNLIERCRLKHNKNHIAIELATVCYVW